MLALNQYLAYNSADSVCQVLAPEIRCGSALPRSAASDLIEVLMLKLKLVIVVSFTVLLLALTGCRGMVAPPEATTLTVMTYNIYVGTEVAGIFTLADPALVHGEISKMYGNIVASDFPRRAVAIARSVKEAQPHLIGLQEVSLIRFGGNEFSFRAILMSALESADLDYEVVAEVENAHIELGGAALTDFDLILARSDVEVARPMSLNYTESLPVPLPGAGSDLKVLRGYAAVDATVGGVTYRVVNTHLEATLEGVPEVQRQFATGIRVAQARELVASLSTETLPLILLGDFNTPAPDGRAYGILLAAEFEDAWQADPVGSGNTCCQAADLRNETSELSKRIDQIFIKGVSLREGAAIRTATVGDQAEDKTDGGLWPSDHAGVVAHLPVE